MNIKPILCFVGGATVGVGGMFAYHMVSQKKLIMKNETAIQEVKDFYRAQFDEQVIQRANEIVAAKIMKGDLVIPRNSVDNPEIVTGELGKEGGEDGEAGDSADESDDHDDRVYGRDPPAVVYKNFFDTHRATPAGNETPSGEPSKEHPASDGRSQMGGDETSTDQNANGGTLLRERGVSQSELTEAALAAREEAELAMQRPGYTRYASYSRAQAKRDTARELAEYEAEQADYNATLEVEKEQLTEMPLDQLAPTEQSPIPFLISREQFEEEYPLYDKETIYYHMTDNILAFENMDMIDDPQLYVGTTAPITLFAAISPGVYSAEPIFIRNHRLGMDLCIYLSMKSYQDALAAWNNS